LGESANWARISLQPLAAAAALDQLSQELDQSAPAANYGVRKSCNCPKPDKLPGSSLRYYGQPQIRNQRLMN